MDDLRFTESAAPGILRGRTVLITGASRGIGRAIALRVARDGANVAILAKTATPHAKLPGTIHSVAAEVEAAGGRALALACDVRDDAQVEDAVRRTAAAFGGIDAVVNNASAIALAGVAALEMRRYDLMQDVNVRGSYAVARAAMPYLLRSPCAHVLALAPPVDLRAGWFAGHTAYTVSKYGMAMVVHGIAAEYAGRVASNALWPRTVVSTAALQAFAGDNLETLHRRSRTAAVVADAAYAVLCQPATWSGVFAIDEAVLRSQGVCDLGRYAAVPGATDLAVDLFVDADAACTVPRMPVRALRPDSRV